MAEQSNTRKEAPKYKLLEKAYLNERLYDPESMPIDQNAEPNDEGVLPRKDLIIAFAGVPAYYMVPVNDAAKAMCAKHADRMHSSNPIDELTVVSAPVAQA